jgi:two-component system phosphate regulon sensor histidine kinase PhoR
MPEALMSEALQAAVVSALTNAAYEALIVLDSRRRILALNKAAEELFSVPHPVGSSLLSISHSTDLEAMIENALDYREEFFEDQVTLNKRVFRVRIQLNQSEDGLLISLALIDITDLVRLNRARRDMVANISHELRTPIANIRLIIDSLFHEDEKPKRKRSITSIQAIARETDSLLWILQEMLDLSMIESGQSIMRMVSVPLRDLVQESVERMEEQAAAKDVIIEHDVSKKLFVLCDWDQIRRVVVNLLHNAIKWTPPGTTIIVEAEASEDQVIIEVRDKGPGVPDDQVERIFERFYQVDSSRSGNEGTGLGLAICKHIVEAHEGRIWAAGRSEAKHGLFSFTLARSED